MEGHCSTGQSPQWAVVPMEEEEEEEKDEEEERYEIFQTNQKAYLSRFLRFYIGQIFNFI